MESVISRIKEEYNNLTKNEKVVADYILANPTKVIHQSIDEVAQATYGSNSNITRFVKKVKLTNFKELCVTLAQEVGFISRQLKESNTENDKVMNMLVDESILSLFELRRMIDEKELDEMLTLLYEAERVDFFGRGVSNLVAQDCHQKFLKVKRVTTSYVDTSMQNTGASTLKPKDLAIFFSYSGETPETLETIKIAKICGAKVVLITKYNSETNAERFADYNIYLPNSYSSDNKLYYAASRLAMLQVVDILYVSYINKYKDSLKGLVKVETFAHLK